jgi:PAS domain S-box-containing protein
LSEPTDRDDTSAAAEASALPTFRWRVADGDLVLESCDETARETPFGRLTAGSFGGSARTLCAPVPGMADDLARCAREHRSFRCRREHSPPGAGEAQVLDLTYAFVPPDQVLMCLSDATARRREEEQWQATQAALATTANRLGQVISNAPVILWTVDTEGVVTLSEGAGLAALGLRPGQAVGQQIRERYADVEPGVRLMERALAGETCHGVMEARGVMLDVHYFPDRNERGEVVGCTGLCVDVTARVRAEHDAQSARLMLSAALQQAGDLIFITDRDGRMVYVNPAFEKHTGYTAAEVLGQTPRLLKSGLEPPELYRRMWETVLGGGIFESVIANRKKDGQVFFEETCIAPIRDGSGPITHFVSVGRDITVRKQAEVMQRRLQEQVQRSAEEWKATFDAVESPLLLLDTQGCIKRLNRAARDLWGGDLAFREIVGRPVSDRRGEPWNAIAGAAAAAPDSAVSLSASAEDERGRTWDIAARSFQSPAGEPSVIVLARDISPLVALQQSLRRSETMSAMGALLAGVAHEVRNPLFGISAAIDAFENEFRERDEFRQYGTLLRAEVARLTTLMHDLLEYGRPVQTQLAPGRLEDVIQRAVRFCALGAREGSVDLVTDLAPDLPPVLMEPGRLVQVFQNVVENAVQHSPAGGRVQVSAAVGNGDGEIRCLVSDAGPGFRTEDRARVFEPFFTRRRGGTGLGLSIVQKIVEEHGGRIQLGNRPEGGATVTISLPFASGAGPEAG